MAERNYTLTINDLTYAQAKTLYANLIGVPFTELHSTVEGHDSFSGNLAMGDGMAEEVYASTVTMTPKR